MTCRLELIYKGDYFPIPSSCPECGLSAICDRGYMTIRQDGKTDRIEPTVRYGMVAELERPVDPADIVKARREREERATAEAAERQRVAAAVVPRLPRVTQAQLMDVIEATLEEAVNADPHVNYAFEKETEQLCQKVLAILAEAGCLKR